MYISLILWWPLLHMNSSSSYLLYRYWIKRVGVSARVQPQHGCLPCVCLLFTQPCRPALCLAKWGWIAERRCCSTGDEWLRGSLSPVTHRSLPETLKHGRTHTGTHTIGTVINLPKYYLGHTVTCGYVIVQTIRMFKSMTAETTDFDFWFVYFENYSIHFPNVITASAQNSIQFQLILTLLATPWSPVMATRSLEITPAKMVDQSSKSLSFQFEKNKPITYSMCKVQYRKFQTYFSKQANAATLPQ